MRIVRAQDVSVPQLAAEVAECVRAGGTVIFPTETVYGIGCDPDNESAVEAIYRSKGRSANKPLALHVSGISQAQPYVAGLNAMAMRCIEHFWPGPVAIIVRRRPGRYERSACGLETISLRCPSHPVCRSLLEAAGPLAATSANASGAPAFTGSEEALGSLPDATLAVLAGPTPVGRESTIVDCTGDTPVILRVGAVSPEQIARVLGTTAAPAHVPDER